MWHTSQGDRTLRGAEATLVGIAIETMIDALMIHIGDEDEDAFVAECHSGIAVYDSLSACQRIGLLHDVARHMLAVTEAGLPLSAATEATVAAVFVEIRDQVAIEIDLYCDDLGAGDSVDSDSGTASDGDEWTWRGLVLAAHGEVSQRLDDEEPGLDSGTRSEELDSEAIEIPDETSGEISEWAYLIERLTSAVLWDRDFEMAESFLDVDPRVSQQRRRLLGIDQDYFTRVAPDPRPEEVSRIVSKTRDIIHAKPR